MRTLCTHDDQIVSPETMVSVCVSAGMDAKEEEEEENNESRLYAMQSGHIIHILTLYANVRGQECGRERVSAHQPSSRDRVRQ